MMRAKVMIGALLAAGMLAAAVPARAELAVSEVIINLPSNAPPRRDVEVINTGKDVMYVAVEPAHIADPGGPAERRIEDPDPQRLGFLATPNKLVLQPGERKLVRFVALQPAAETDRIYRVRIRQVVGKIQAKTSALKIAIGYDVLVIQRPKDASESLAVAREGDVLVFKNSGNTNVLLYDGKQCAQGEKNCRTLDVKRIYAGREWRMRLRGAGEVSFFVDNGQRTIRKTF